MGKNNNNKKTYVYVFSSGSYFIMYIPEHNIVKLYVHVDKSNKISRILY